MEDPVRLVMSMDTSLHYLPLFCMWISVKLTRLVGSRNDENVGVCVVGYVWTSVITSVRKEQKLMPEHVKTAPGHECVDRSRHQCSTIHAEHLFFDRCHFMIVVEEMDYCYQEHCFFLSEWVPCSEWVETFRCPQVWGSLVSESMHYRARFWGCLFSSCFAGS